jgi:hypothetical protein
MVIELSGVQSEINEMRGYKTFNNFYIVNKFVFLI